MGEMGLDNKKIVIVVFTQKDLVKHKENPSLAFDKVHYYANPNQYESKFA